MIYKTYLSHCLALNGYNCYLGSKTNISYLIRKLKNYIYIDKGYHKGVSENIYKIIKKNGGKIVSLDEEGAVDYNNNSTLLGRYAQQLFNNVDFTFFWGNQQYEIVKRNMTKESKFQITGHPRFELLKPEYHYLYKQEVDKIKNKYNNFILINTNMSFGNNIKGDDFVRSNYSDRFNKLDESMKFDKKKIEIYKRLILNLANKGENIIVRPHPEEDKTFYEKAFRGYSNINVIYEGSVIPWLLCSDIMIHPDCTTAIESLFIGKEPISYLPKNYPEDLVTKLPLISSQCFINQDDLIKYISNNKKNINMIDSKKYPFIEENFSLSKLTTKIIVDQINSIIKNYVYLSPDHLSYYSKAYLMLKSLKAILINNLPSQKLYKNKLKGLSYSSVKNIRKNLCKANSDFNKVNLKRLNRNLFYISNSNL